MKKTRLLSMFLAIALVVSCFSVTLAAAPVDFVFPGHKAELSLGDWAGVIQSNPQNSSSAAGNGYLYVKTAAYPQGVLITTTDSAYALDSAKEYTLEIKMRTAAENTSYYRIFYGNAAGSPDSYAEVKPADYVAGSSGFPVEATGWVVKTCDLNKAVSGQLGIKIHGGSVGSGSYGDSFDIDYIKVTEKSTGAEFFYEDFDDTDVKCAYATINNAQSASVKGVTAIKGGYLLLTNRTHAHQGFTYSFDYNFEAGVKYTLSFDLDIVSDEMVRIYLYNTTNDKVDKVSDIGKPTLNNTWRDGKTATAGNNKVTMEINPTTDLSGTFSIKMHSAQTPVAGNDIKIDNIKITNDSEKPEYTCSFDSVDDNTGCFPYIYPDSKAAGLPELSLEGIATYTAGNGYVHVGDRLSGVSGAAYKSITNLTAGETYTIKIKMRASESDELIRIIASGNFDITTSLSSNWTELTKTFTAAATAPLSFYIHSGSYGHAFTDFDIDSLVVTNSSGAPVINETYDNDCGTWAVHGDKDYIDFQDSTVTHQIDKDCATVPGSAAVYTPADQMSLRAGTYEVTGTFRVPFSRANLVVARAFQKSGNTFAPSFIMTYLIADNNKINVGVEIEDVNGNFYYAEENSVAVTSIWTDVRFEVEIPENIVVKNIKFIGKDGVTPVAGTYAFGSETVEVGLLKTLFDDDTADDQLNNSPMLVQIPSDVTTYRLQSYIKDNYATIAGLDGFTAEKFIPFQFSNIKLTMTEIKPVESEASSGVGVLAVLILRRAVNALEAVEASGN